MAVRRHPHVRLPHVRLPYVRLPHVRLPHVRLPHLGRRRLPALLALLVALAVPLLGARPASAASGLSADQERSVLRLVDDICGDTWCEGDFSFQFRSLTCQQERATCRLRLRIAPYTDEAPRWRTRSGTVRGFTTFEQMVRTSDNGWQSLQPDFYAAVSDLVNRIEARTAPAALDV